MDLPKHIAIVMDGNGRWAEKRGYPRIFGHVRGCSRVREAVTHCATLGISALTLFAFSTENWNRPKEEVELLWRLMKKFLIRDADELARNNIRLSIIGERHRLSRDIEEVLTPLIERLRWNTGMSLTFALSYGARAELAQAARNFAQDCISGARLYSEMNESVFEEYLYQTGGPMDVDLFIRTSGEQRMSNFLLWQSAYAEFVFDGAYWPDFGMSNIDAAIEAYRKRNRRFGRLPLAAGESK